MLFTIVSIGLAAVIAAILFVTLVRGRRGDAPTAAYDLRVYQDQLREVERDLARGIITEEEAGRIRNEVSRRVLEADRKLKQQTGATQAPQGANLVAGVVIVVALLGGAWLVYSRTGAPGYPDLPLSARIAAADEARQDRPRQAEAEAEAIPFPNQPAADPEHVAMVAKLRDVVAERGDDLRGYLLLARNEAALGNFQAAYKAQSKAIELKQGRATAEDFATLADMMVLAAGGYVSPEAEAALVQALNRDSSDGTSLYYWGLMQIQVGRPDIAFRIWRQLLSISQPDDPWVAPVRSQMEELAWRAGVEYTLPPLAAGPMRGPSSEDMEAAADMTPEQRQEMIRGMVANLSDRLATEGGSPQQWAQLVNALGVLGDTAQASAIWTEAQQVFAQNPQALETVRAAARAAGVAE
ncbi:MAG: c-type cytochrome biogenesis protein CcmI [Rhodobacteraceae bacterium]|nr:c-type cytochrome biogenesis protein CcmI [Paracoccaceae bacterium]